MVPAAFMVIDELPLTVNGKLDRRALPAPDYTTTEAYLAPQGPVEEVLASLYAQILGGSDRVSAADSFFDLGGDSLSAMRLIAAANTTLHAGLRVADVFEAPPSPGSPTCRGRPGRSAAIDRRPPAAGAVVVCPVPAVVS
ncbi:Dimodular nonribosomal peptide synthase [Mycobacterium marinum]|nr:Dimodular nonribosomal peptide synthase [Mycobacterium marinum]